MSADARYRERRRGDDLGLTGEVTPEAYEAAFGPGGFRLPPSGEQLTATKRPGVELVIGPHKSVAVLGVIGRADDMHAILDTETAATLQWLEQWFQERGGSRGRAQTRTPTAGFIYAVTRHATSRDGDPRPHDHILIANVTRMLDAKGGFKALDTAALRDTVEAATMVGRLHAAATAIRLGYRIEVDQGDSGRARRWRIVGIPDEVCDLFSKRADEIAEYLEEQGYTGYRARNVAARPPVRSSATPAPTSSCPAGSPSWRTSDGRSTAWPLPSRPPATPAPASPRQSPPTRSRPWRPN